MRHISPLMAISSGFVVTAACFLPVMVAGAVETPSGSHQVTAMNATLGDAPTQSTKVVCSQNRSLSGLPSNLQLASSSLGSSAVTPTSSIIRLFCRDVRINTIVVREYCAVLRQ